MTMGEVQAMNAVGVDLILQGNLKQAAMLLSEAITEISRLVPSPTTSQGNVGDISVYAATEDCFSKCPYYIVAQAPACEYYTHPFLFECSASEQSKEPALTRRQLHFAAICILFNLGLTLHLEWQRHKNKLQILEKAVQFYEQGLGLIRECAFVPSDSVLQALMASSVNVTHCHLELMNLSQVQEYNNLLRYLIHFSSSAQALQHDVSGDKQEQLDDDDDHMEINDFFSLNAFFNSFGRTAAQAA